MTPQHQFDRRVAEVKPIKGYVNFFRRHRRILSLPSLGFHDVIHKVGNLSENYACGEPMTFLLNGLGLCLYHSDIIVVLLVQEVC